MILEGIVITADADGSAHIAAMGPRVDPAISRLTLRPFQTSHTFRNLQSRPSGVLHVTDDVELLVQAALDIGSVPPLLEPARKVRGHVLVDCCRWFEFEVTDIDNAAERAEIGCRIIHHGEKRPFFGFNRAKHAVVEAAVLATRVDLLLPEVIAEQIERLKPLVDKTAGDGERRAWKLVSEFLSRRISATISGLAGGD